MPRRLSLAGKISRHVVHQPVSTVSTNSSGSFSSRIADARASWAIIHRHELSPPVGTFEDRIPDTGAAVVIRPSEYADVDEVSILTEPPCHLMPVCDVDHDIGLVRGREMLEEVRRRGRFPEELIDAPWTADRRTR